MVYPVNTRQSLSYNVVSSTPCHEWGSNSQREWWWALIKQNIIMCKECKHWVWNHVKSCLQFQLGVNVNTVQHILHSCSRKELVLHHIKIIQKWERDGTTWPLTWLPLENYRKLGRNDKNPAILLLILLNTFFQGFHIDNKEYHYYYLYFDHFFVMMKNQSHFFCK